MLQQRERELEQQLAGLAPPGLAPPPPPPSSKAAKHGRDGGDAVEEEEEDRPAERSRRARRLKQEDVDKLVLQARAQVRVCLRSSAARGRDAGTLTVARRTRAHSGVCRRDGTRRSAPSRRRMNGQETWTCC